MSYNPAFVADESPLANSSDNKSSSSNGIKLTSFKVLPSQSSHINTQDNVVVNIDSNCKLNNNDNQNSSSGSSRRRKVTGASKQLSSSQKRNHKSLQQSVLQQQQLNANNNNNSNNNNNNNAVKTTNKQNNNNNFCLSTSSSLSLIDNPTLSSLTPSASSYSTTTSSSSIVSTSSSTTTGLCAAVECRDMRYDVGRGRNQKTILYNINVTVPEGSIYGLLGPSGCGKTTMLRCVVGRIKPKEGYVRVFGYKPNDSGSQIPGPAIGYMPQVSVFYSLYSMFIYFLTAY